MKFSNFNVLLFLELFFRLFQEDKYFNALKIIMKLKKEISL